MKQFNKVKGSGGEAVATAYLEKQGFTILESNFSCKIGEIDLVACKGDCIHFVEVKYRRSADFGYGRESVTRGKQQTIRKVATWYLVEKGLLNEVDVSFDVIEIMGDINGKYKLEYLEACF